MRAPPPAARSRSRRARPVRPASPVLDWSATYRSFGRCQPLILTVRTASWSKAADVGRAAFPPPGRRNTLPGPRRAPSGQTGPARREYRGSTGGNAFVHLSNGPQAGDRADRGRGGAGRGRGDRVRRDVQRAARTARRGPPHPFPHDGRQLFSSPPHTGTLAPAPADGPFPVYERLRSQFMSGTNPDGPHYADPVEWWPTSTAATPSTTSPGTPTAGRRAWAAWSCRW